MANETGAPNQQAKALAVQLEERLQRLMYENENSSRLLSESQSAILYRNLFYMLCGSICSEIGLDKAMEIVEPMIKKEREHHASKRIITAGTGWRAPR